MALQETVRDIDSGTTAKIVRTGMVTIVVIGLCIVYFLIHFKGLGTEQAMDQAQIARSLISKEGFTTRYIRPLAIRQLSDAGKAVPAGNFPEFYNAPLFPLLEAVALFPVKNRIDMAATDTLSMGDRVIAMLGIVLMLAGIAVWYFVGRLLFDRTIALLGCGLLLVTDLMWQYAVSGLPQHLLIVLFGLVSYCALRAKNSEAEEPHTRVNLWIGFSALGLGAVMLTNRATAFLAPGFLAVGFLALHTRHPTFLLVPVVYLSTVFPRLARFRPSLATRTATGNPSNQAHLWLAGAALGLGLMSLASGVTAFLLPGFLAFCLIAFYSRIPAFLIPLGVYLLTVLPWLLHNHQACGNAFGLSVYTIMSGAGISEASLMRGVNTGLSLGGGLASKFRTGLLDQASHLWEYFGLNITVVAFTISLLHPFRNPTAALWRWVVLMMWVGGAIGMALFGVKEVVSGGQVHLIFLPVVVFYGMAFLLVLWNRLNISMERLRIAFLSAVFVVTGAPMVFTLLGGQDARIQWPPYVPPFIAVLHNWFAPRELLSSDMPWAVAWYANRKCLLLPETIRQFNEISDFGTLGTPVVGLYLTPISGRQSFIDLVKGPYKEWGPVIMRTVNLNDFLLKNFTPLPIDGECILYADSPRWSARTRK